MSKIYIAESDGYYKIGVSTNPQSRVATMQVGNPHTVTLVSSVDSLNGTVGSLENVLHGWYSKYHKHGEWFDLPQSIAAKWQTVDSVDVSLLKECMWSSDYPNTPTAGRHILEMITEVKTNE